MKRTLIAILTIVLILTGMPLCSFAEAEIIDYDFEKNFLEDLGVLSATDLSNPSEKVTRADFVYYVAKLLKISEFPSVDRNYFEDVAPGDSASELINYFAEANYVSRGTVFEPSRPIKSSEAYKILETILGYDVIAINRGGFTSGYDKVASDLEWIKLSPEVNANEFVKLLFDAANTPYYTITSINKNGDSATYSDELGETILSTMYNIYHIEGFVGSVNGIHLSGVYADNGYIAIGDKVLLNGNVAKPEDYLALECEAFYLKKQGEKDTLFAIRPSLTDNSIEIDSSLIVKMGSDHTLQYYKNEADMNNNKISRIRISPTIEVVKNGAIIDRDLISLFNTISNGKVVFQKSGSNGYDYAVIKEYQDVFVSYYDSEESVIYVEGSNEKYNLEDYDNLNIYSLGGAKLDSSALSSDTLIGIATDGLNNMEIITGYDKKGGVVEAIFDKGLVIDGISYDYAKKVLSNCKVAVGGEYTLYLNRYGEIAYIVPGLVSNMEVGYILDVDKTKGLEAKMMARIFTTKGEFKELTFNENVKVDGKKNKAEDVYALFKNDDGTPNHQLIRFSVNSGGLISVIDRAVSPMDYNQSAENADNLLKESALVDDNPGDPLYKVYYSGAATLRRIGVGSMVSTSTVYMQIPTVDNLDSLNYDDYSFKTGTMDEMVIPDMSYNLKCFKLNDDLVEDVVVIYKDLAMPYDDYNAKLLVVERVTEALNKEGVPAKQIVGFMGGAKMYIPLADEYDSSVTLPDNGDLIAPNLNTKGELTSYFTCYDFSEDEVYVKNGIEPVKFGEVQMYDGTDYAKKWQLAYGFAYDKSGVTMSISSSPTDIAEECVEQVLNVGAYGFTMVDSDERGNVTLSNGDMSEVRTYANIKDTAETSRVIVYTRFRNLKDIIIYK